MENENRVPNPEDWTGANGAALILNRDRATVYDYVRRGVIKRYGIGGRPMFWVPELKTVAAALETVGRK